MPRLVCCLVLLAAPLSAQPTARFTPEAALGVVSYSVLDLSNDGAWLAASSAARADRLGVDYRRDGDPSYLRPARSRLWVIERATGAARSVFPDARLIQAAAWSPDGRRLAILSATGEELEGSVWERETGRMNRVRVPSGKYLAENSELTWSRSGERIVFALRSAAWRTETRKRFAEMTAGPVFVQSSEDPFLAWEQLRRRGARRSVAAYHIANATVTELVPEGMIPSWRLADDDSTVVFAEDITPRTDYDVIFGTETRLVARVGPATRTVMASTKGASNLLWSPDGLHYAFSRDGKLWTGAVADSTPRQIAGTIGAAKPDTSRAAKALIARERFSPVRWSLDGHELIAKNSEGLWIFGARDSTRSMFLATSDTGQGPRYTVVDWSADRQTVRLAVASKEQWERGFATYDRQANHLTETVKDGRMYGTPRFSRDGRAAVLTVATGSRPADLYTATGDLTQLTRLVETNPALTTVETGPTELINYLDADGRNQYGVVYYPPDYHPGRPYPTVFYVYESFFDDRYESIISTLTAAGYVVVQPSVSLETGHPGEAWLKGVTAAANHLIARGIADSARLGVQGISYGGYATNLLITQTKRFKAAINISGKVDMISFYTDSPRLGVRNIHAAEKSQDRIGATLWEQPQKYIEHSAVMFADRITTPLLLVTGDQDSNVPADNSREMYYALRRLGKTVTWANYMNGGHGTPMTTAADFLDFHRRLVSWYDKYLKAASGEVSQ